MCSLEQLYWKFFPPFENFEQFCHFWIISLMFYQLILFFGSFKKFWDFFLINFLGNFAILLKFQYSVCQLKQFLLVLNNFIIFLQLQHNFSQFLSKFNNWCFLITFFWAFPKNFVWFWTILLNIFSSFGHLEHFFQFFNNFSIILSTYTIFEEFSKNLEFFFINFHDNFAFLLKF